jgi:hypothetical protein
VPRIESGRVGSVSIRSSPPAQETACRDARLVFPRQKLRLIHRRKCPPAYNAIYPGADFSVRRASTVRGLRMWQPVHGNTVFNLTSSVPSTFYAMRCSAYINIRGLSGQTAFPNTSPTENGMASRLPPMRRETRRSATVYLTHASRAHSNGSTCAFLPSVRLWRFYLRASEEVPTLVPMAQCIPTQHGWKQMRWGPRHPTSGGCAREV